MGSQVASDSPYPSDKGKEFPTLFVPVTCNTCNHVVAVNCHFMGSHFFEFVCLPNDGSFL